MNYEDPGLENMITAQICGMEKYRKIREQKKTMKQTGCNKAIHPLTRLWLDFILRTDRIVPTAGTPCRSKVLQPNYSIDCWSASKLIYQEVSLPEYKATASSEETSGSAFGVGRLKVVNSVKHPPHRNTGGRPFA